jgi:hypothetical protein
VTSRNKSPAAGAIELGPHTAQMASDATKTSPGCITIISARGVGGRAGEGCKPFTSCLDLSTALMQHSAFLRR